MSGITVGIDGSHNSHRALDWAVQEAATRHCGLTVLTVHPVIASWVTGEPVTVSADKGLQEKERLAVEEATEKALKDAEPGQARVGAGALNRWLPGRGAYRGLEGQRPAGHRGARRRRLPPAHAGLDQQPGRAPRCLPGRRRARAGTVIPC